MQITPRIFLDEADIIFEYIRASGPGGQNVNKVASAVRLRVRLDALFGLDDDARRRLEGLAGRRVTADGELLIRSEEHRTQEANRKAALDRLVELVVRASVREKPRRATKPSRAATERRLTAKSNRSRLKKLRREPPD